MTDVKTPARSAKEQFDRQAAHYNAQWNAWSEESLAWLGSVAVLAAGSVLFFLYARRRLRRPELILS